MKRIIIILLLSPMIMLSQTTFAIAEKLFKEEKFDQAQIMFEALLKNNSNNPKTIEYLGDIAGHNKSWDQAITCYKKLIQIKPTEANYYYKYGGALGMKAKESNKFAALGMIDEIKKSFEKAIVLSPKHINARWALLELYLQLPGIIGGSQSKAIKYSTELREISAVDGYLSKGHIDEYFKRYNSAEEQYKRAILIGDSKVSYQMLASLYKNKMNAPEKARAVLEEYTKKNKQ